MLVSRSFAPRLSPTTIVRPRLNQWLDREFTSPIRLILGPAGTGKTTMLLRYALETDRDVAYCALPRDCTVVGLQNCIALALKQDAPQTEGDLAAIVSSYAAKKPFELTVDDADNGCREAIDALHRLIEAVPSSVRLTYAARSRERIRAERLVARGIADVCGDTRLFFNSEECLLLAQSYGIDASELQARRLVEDTDGWALAVACAIRTAAAERVMLDQAFTNWRSGAQPFLRDFLHRQLECATEHDRQAFEALQNGRAVVDRSRLNELQARGLFIIEDACGSLRIYHACVGPCCGICRRSPPRPGPHAQCVSRCFVLLRRRLTAERFRGLGAAIKKS
jgi:ATP/maltotriose-dependent transcriptional regulator MalT